MALPIIAVNMMRGGAVLIDLSDIFMTDFAQLGLGTVDRSRSSWAKVKGFQNNMELEVETTFSGGGDGLRMARMTGGRPPGHHGRHPLQPDEDPDYRLPPPAGRRPRRPLLEREQGFRHHRPGLQLRPA